VDEAVNNKYGDGDDIGPGRTHPMSESVSYPKCPVCDSGYLLPVILGGGGEKDVKYRCTNPNCGVRFDKHGYEKYDPVKQDFVRMREY
jgi:hypothetical protein